MADEQLNVRGCVHRGRAVAILMQRVDTPHLGPSFIVRDVPPIVFEGGTNGKADLLLKGGPLPTPQLPSVAAKNTSTVTISALTSLPNMSPIAMTKPTIFSA